MTDTVRPCSAMGGSSAFRKSEGGLVLRVSSVDSFCLDITEIHHPYVISL